MYKYYVNMAVPRPRRGTLVGKLTFLRYSSGSIEGGWARPETRDRCHDDIFFLSKPTKQDTLGNESLQIPFEQPKPSEELIMADLRYHVLWGFYHQNDRAAANLVKELAEAADLGYKLVYNWSENIDMQKPTHTRLVEVTQAESTGFANQRVPRKLWGSSSGVGAADLVRMILEREPKSCVVIYPAGIPGIDAIQANAFEKMLETIGFPDVES